VADVLTLPAVADVGTPDGIVVLTVTRLPEKVDAIQQVET